jgi:Fe2+ or Zn2+ uptake regulation protein
MIDQLFGSKTRVKLLYLFYGNPNRSFYVREITRKIDEQINSVRRELSNLLTIGIIKSDSNNNRLYYEINQSHEFYKPLHEIFNSNSNSTLSSSQTNQQKRFREIGQVRSAYLMGKYVRDKSMPVDLFIIGDVNKTKLEKLVAELEKEEGFEINYSQMSSKDFEYRKIVKDRFITDVVNAKKTIIIDEITTKGKE